MPVYAKTISSWVRNVLSTAKAHMSLGKIQGNVLSMSLTAGVSLVSILWADYWVPKFLLQLDTIFQHISLLYHRLAPGLGAACCPGP